MSTSAEFHDYCLEELRRAAPVYSRKMMGEYCLYLYDKVIGLICDNTLLLKPTSGVDGLLADAPRSYPYEGSKTLMYVVENFEDTELMREVLNTLFDELPEKKSKKAKPTE